MHRRHLPSASSSSGPPWARQDDAPVWLVLPVVAEPECLPYDGSIHCRAKTFEGVIARHHNDD
jgi:hypothetical protein